MCHACRIPTTAIEKSDLDFLVQPTPWVSECGMHKPPELNPFWTLHWPVPRVCRDQNFILSWDGCIVGTAMSGPRTTAWQGHSRTKCRGNWCCKHCKAGLHFVHDGESFCACVQCPGASTALQTALVHVCSVQGPLQLCRQPWLQSSRVNPGKSQLPLPMRSLFKQLKARTTQAGTCTDCYKLANRSCLGHQVYSGVSLLYAQTFLLAPGFSFSFADPITSQHPLEGAPGTCTEYLPSCVTWSTRVKAEPSTQP